MALRESDAVKQRPVRASELEIPDDYIVLERNPEGTVVLGPVTSWEAMQRRLGIEEPSSDAEAERLLDEHRPYMLPPDGEG